MNHAYLQKPVSPSNDECSFGLRMFYYYEAVDDLLSQRTDLVSRSLTHTVSLHLVAIDIKREK